MATDWKDTLAALGASGTLPEGTEISLTENAPSNLPTLRILLDRKGRKGKTATIIEGFTQSDDEVANIAKSLKQKIGTGGSSRGGEILLQGDWFKRASELLSNMGYKIKT